MRRIWNEVLTFLAVAFLVAFSYPAFNENVSIGTQSLIDVVQLVCWVAFAADLIYGIWNAESKYAYLKKHPLEVMSVVLPFLRPLRLLRVISFGGLAIQKLQ